ncbi:Fe-S cluster assembly protein SufD [Candidatus Protochlamydia sp. W-9]|uniref:Fe-S cluster assembly protein SufD n=1 Tax=Candidatus Protochlamydia sp. W-9 TaxID=1785087 RepID=UPI000A5FCCDA|nr:Fe-S cluster assembly protein SufD [Candidatus Protochlamydia sp. W-9]
MTFELGLEQKIFTSLLEKHLDAINQGDPLQKARQKAWSQFLERGLPTKQSEAYRYIKLRHLFSQNYEFPKEESITKDQIASLVYPECQHSFLVFINGQFCSEFSETKNLPSQVIISTLQEANQTFGTFFNNYWSKSLKEENDSFALINSALHHQGAFIYIPPKTIVEIPIQILHLVQAQGQLLMLMPRINVCVGAQAEVKFVSSIHQKSMNGYFINQVTDFLVEDQAYVHYTQILNEEHVQAWHFEAVRAHLKKQSTFKTVCITEGGMTVRNDYHISLSGENAEVLLNGISMLEDKREVHTHIFIDHQAPNCRSYQLFKAVLNDFSRSSFEGKIMVRQKAQKTEAFQLNNNLLLSDHAHADSKPNLEIFADDVKASHGATVGQLDAEQLFYMKTRGFPEMAAKNLLIYGFAEQVIEMIPINSIKEAISQRAHRYLTKG